MSRFFYVTTEIFKNKTELIIIGMLLIALAIGVFSFINILILIIRSFRRKKLKKEKKKFSLKSKLPYIVTTALSFVFLLSGVSIIIYQYTSYWNLDHKEYTLDNLSQSELEKLGLSSATINAEIDTKEVASHTVREKEIKFLSTPERSFNQNEINATLSIIEDLPEPILEKLPQKIEFVSYKDYEGYIAWAQGNRIYFSNITFKVDYPHRQFEKTVIHELVHLTQYNSIPRERLKEHIYQFKKINLEEDSQYLIDYAESVGWKRTDNGESFVIDPKLELHQTSEYAKVGGPIEDMAETISLYLIGEKAVLSEGRIEWVENNISTNSSKRYNIPRFSEYKWITYIPQIEASYFTITSTWNLYTDNPDTHFTINLDKEKEVVGERFMIKEFGYQNNSNPVESEKVAEEWKKEMEKTGWKLEKEDVSNDKHGIQTTEMIFSGPNQRAKITIEDRRNYTEKVAINILKENIAFNKTWNIDYSFYESSIEDLKTKEQDIREQGVFVSIEHGKNIKTSF